MRYRAQVPGKLVLFGEWAVLQGAPALAVAVSAQFTLDYDSRGEFAVQIKSPEGDHLFASLHDSVLQSKFAWFLKVFHYFMLPEKGRYTLHRDWRLSEGLGSSSAVFLSLRGLSHILQGRDPQDSLALWQHASPELRVLQGGGSGIDLATQIFGGTICLRKDQVETLNLKFPPQLRLLHTGHKFTTADELQKRTLSLSQYRTLEQSTESFLLKFDWPLAIEGHNVALKELGVFTPEIQALENEWKSLGYIDHLKTTGAGGGDTLLTLIRPEAEDKFRQAAKDKGFWFSQRTWQVPGAKFSVENS